MAWVAPTSTTTGCLITAAQWNSDVVANVQYVHDNRSQCIPLGSNPDTSWGGANEAYDAQIYTYYKGSIIDKADLTSAKLAVMTYGGTCDVYSRLYNCTAGASIVGSEVFHTTTSPCAYLESGDIKANLPTTDVVLAVQHRTTATAQNWRCRWAGLWLDF